MIIIKLKFMLIYSSTNQKLRNINDESEFLFWQYKSIDHEVDAVKKQIIIEVFVKMKQTLHVEFLDGYLSLIVD